MFFNFTQIAFVKYILNIHKQNKSREMSGPLKKRIEMDCELNFKWPIIERENCELNFKWPSMD